MQDNINQKISDFNKAAAYYGEKGEDELVKDIIAKVTKQKQEGTLTDAQLKEFAKKISPLLNERQRQRMQEILAKLTNSNS